MKSQMQSILFAVLVSACGSDRGVSVDPLSFMPQLPAVQQPAIVVPAPEPVKVAIVEPHVMPTKFDDAMAQGRELAAKNDRAGAREMFEAAIKLDKKRAEPHLELAKMFIASGNSGLAIAAANKAVKLVPLSSAGVEHQRSRRAQPVRLRRRNRGVHEVGRAQPRQRLGVEQPRLYRACS